MKIRNVFMLMAVAALASCSKSEIDNPTTDVTVTDEIALSSKVVQINPVTRIAYDRTDLEENPLTALVLTADASGNYVDDFRCEGSMTFNGGNVVYNKPVYRGTYALPSGSIATLVYLTGLYPATIRNSSEDVACWNTTTDPGTARMVLTGKEDVMFAGEQSTSKENIAAGNYAELEFEHQLTLMKFFFYGNTDATNAETEVTGLQLIAVQGSAVSDTVKVNLSDQSVSFATADLEEGQAPVTLACYDRGSDNVAFSNTVYVIGSSPTSNEQAYILAPPVTASATNSSDALTYEYTFKVYYQVSEGDETVSKNLEVKIDLTGMDAQTAYTEATAGKAFNIRLQFVGGQIQATASVTDWEHVGNVDMEI